MNKQTSFPSVSSEVDGIKTFVWSFPDQTVKCNVISDKIEDIVFLSQEQVAMFEEGYLPQAIFGHVGFNNCIVEPAETSQAPISSYSTASAIITPDSQAQISSDSAQTYSDLITSAIIPPYSQALTSDVMSLIICLIIFFATIFCIRRQHITRDEQENANDRENNGRYYQIISFFKDTNLGFYRDLQQ